jgi:uncharacterized protein (TIGR03435 family)
MRPIALLALALAAASLYAQKPEFEVASVRVSNPQAEATVTAGMRLDGAQVRFTALTLKGYISAAYRVKLYQITGPDWINTERYDISATLPENSKAQVPEMLQTLLADRFGLKFHREKKDFPVYVLEQAKGGVKLQPVAQDAVDPEAATAVAGTGSAQGIAINLGRGASIAFADNRFEAKKLTMAQAAASLERFVDRPVVDMTGVAGAYDFTLDLSEDDYRGMLIRSAINAGVVLPPQALKALEGASMGSLFSSLDKLGLKLDARKSPLDLLVVDQALKSPSSN